MPDACAPRLMPGTGAARVLRLAEARGAGACGVETNRPALLKRRAGHRVLPGSARAAQGLTLEFDSQSPSSASVTVDGDRSVVRFNLRLEELSKRAPRRQNVMPPSSTRRHT